MIRKLVGSLIVIAAVAVVIDTAGGQQPTNVPDKIVVRNNVKKDGSVITYEGKLKLSPVGLQVLSGEKLDKATTIHFADIVRFEPGDMPGVNRDDMLAQLKLESNKNKKDYETAKSVYSAMLKKAASSPEPTKRYLEFRVVSMSTKIADESADDEKWSELADLAAKEWTGFLTDYKAGWEIWPAARSLARLYVELNKYEEAAKMWGRVAKNPELPPDLKLEAGIQEIDAHFRAKAYSTAATLAEALGKSTGPGAAKDKLAIYERAAKAADGGLKENTVQVVVDHIRKKIAESKDATVRGVGYGVIGELYTLVNRHRDAMWEYLTVETVYNADKDEVLKAMCRLVEAFKAQMDEDRPKTYREKIRRFRSTF
jgi:tetratricopeptide (TPR) repeat protein